MPRLHSAKTVAWGFVKWGRCVRMTMVHSVTRGWQDIGILLRVMGATQPPIPCPRERCLVISAILSSRHFSKTYPRKLPPSGTYLMTQVFDFAIILKTPWITQIVGGDATLYQQGPTFKGSKRTWGIFLRRVLYPRAFS
jgi:hypothetical protein